MAVAAVASTQRAAAAFATWAPVLAGEAAPAYDGHLRARAAQQAGEAAAPAYDGHLGGRAARRAGSPGGGEVEAAVSGLDGLGVDALAAVGAAVIARLGDNASVGDNAWALMGLAGEAVATLGGQALADGEDEAALVDSVDGLARLERVAAAERHRRVAAIDQRQAYRAWGQRCTEDLLAQRHTLSRGQAKAEADTARGLARLPRTAGRLAAGALGVDQVQVAARAAVGVDDQLPDDTPAKERAEVLDELDELAADHCDGLNRGQVKTTVDAWRHAIDNRYLVERERRAHRDRTVSLGTDDAPGRVRLSQDGRALVAAALEPLARPREAGDTRTKGQRTHDALVELCQRHLDAGPLPDVAAQRPHAIITTTAEGYRDIPGAAPAVLDGVGAVSNSLATLLVCDGEVTEVVTDQDGNPLVVTEPAHPTRKQRLAAIARDQTCIGCGAPAMRCQLHHRVWRDHHGATVTDNLVLVCTPCHRHIHYDHYHITHHNGRFRLDPPERPEPPGDPPNDQPGGPPDEPPNDPPGDPPDERRAGP